MDERHHLTFDTYEAGKLSLDEYLERVVFYEPRYLLAPGLSGVHVLPVSAFSRDD